MCPVPQVLDMEPLPKPAKPHAGAWKFPRKRRRSTDADADQPNGAYPMYWWSSTLDKL